MDKILGKTDRNLIEQLICAKSGHKRKEVTVGPQFGVDVSIVNLPGKMALAATSDPLSLIPPLGLEESAWLSVQLLANDMATTGFAPQYAQFVLNLPAGFSKNDFKIYWDYIHTFCADIGVAVTGGHTGFIEGQNSTIAGGGTFFAIAPENQLLVSRNARPGDTILVTKECALSSASILALSFPQTIKNKLGVENHQKACDLFYKTTSLLDGLVAVGHIPRYDDVTAMHDVTEGGVLGAIYELVSASGNGAVVYNHKLPVGHVQQKICGLFGIDPRYSIGAGSMIITCKKGSAAKVMERLTAINIPCCEVGEIKEKESGIKLVENKKKKDLEYKEEDPYWAAFFKALKEGWK